MPDKVVYVAQKGNATRWEVPSRPLEPNEVRIKTKSAGINPIDWKTIDANLADGAAQGNDFAGTVIEVGSEVKHTKVGDTVAGGVGGGNVDDKEQGTFASEIRLAEDLLFRFPTPLKDAGSDEISSSVPTTFEQAASLGIAAVTTAIAFEKHENPQPGEYALIFGATSSLGFYALQYARSIGYKVIAVSAPSPILEGLGVEWLDRHTDWVAKAKEISGDNITFALDAIALDNSQDLVVQTTKKVLAISDPGTAPSKVPEGITVEHPLYFFCYQEVKKLGPHAFPDPEKTIARGPELVAKINELFAKKAIKALPIRVLHGLDKVNDGLQLSRKGVRGLKVVIDVE